MEVTSSNNKVAIEVKTTDSFFCPICMECVPLLYTVKWTSCKHMYFFYNLYYRCCRNCLFTYAVTSINSGIVHIKCFIPECNEYLSPQYIRLLLPDSIYRKYIYSSN